MCQTRHILVLVAEAGFAKLLKINILCVSELIFFWIIVRKKYGEFGAYVYEYIRQPSERWPCLSCGYHEENRGLFYRGSEQSVGKLIDALTLLLNSMLLIGYKL